MVILAAIPPSPVPPPWHHRHGVLLCDGCGVWLGGSEGMYCGCSVARFAGAAIMTTDYVTKATLCYALVVYLLLYSSRNTHTPSKYHVHYHQRHILLAVDSRPLLSCSGQHKASTQIWAGSVCLLCTSKSLWKPEAQALLPATRLCCVNTSWTRSPKTTRRPTDPDSQVRGTRCPRPQVLV